MSKLAPYTELVSRRRALGLFGATATLLGCGGGGSDSATTSTAASRRLVGRPAEQAAARAAC